MLETEPGQCLSETLSDNAKERASGQEKVRDLTSPWDGGGDSLILIPYTWPFL